MVISQNNTITEFINNLNLHISFSGVVETGPEWNENNILGECTRIYCITNGNGEISYNGKTVFLEKGNIYIIPKGLVFNIKCDKYLKKTFFHIHLSKIDNKDLFDNISEVEALYNKEELIKELTNLYLKNDELSGVLLKNKIIDISLSVLKKYEMNLCEIKKYSKTTKEAMIYIENHIFADLSAQEIAENLFISKSKLQKCFKDEIGISIKKYIAEKVLSSAEKDISRGLLSIDEISSKYHFCDRFYFSKKYREKYHIPPAKYKKKFNI